MWVNTGVCVRRSWTTNATAHNTATATSTTAGSACRAMASSTATIEPKSTGPSRLIWPVGAAAGRARPRRASRAA